MTKRITVVATYDGDADAIFRSTLQFSDMTDAMAGLATYEGLPESGTAKEGDRFTVDVTFWGIFKQRGHAIYVERIDVENRTIQSRESGEGVKRWDHSLTITQDGPQARWVDDVVIDAGWRTAIVARFARYVYRRRHRRRNAESVVCSIVPI